MDDYMLYKNSLAYYLSQVSIIVSFPKWIYNHFVRYWSHTVKCSSCSTAYKSLNVLELALQVISIASIGIIAASKQGLMSVAKRNTLIAMAMLCFLASRWLSNFTYKTFRFHDYDHAFRWNPCILDLELIMGSLCGASCNQTLAFVVNM